LNTARNALNELGIAKSDPVAKRIYGSLTNSDMTKIMDQHKDLPAIYDQLKTMVKTNNPDAQWLSSWLTKRIADQTQLFTKEQESTTAAKNKQTTFVPQFNNFVMAKVYQDQALLDMAYAANGKDVQSHMKSAHDMLQQARQHGWYGHQIKTENGEIQQRLSDLPKLTEMYKSLGGTVDW
jgi:hypothetical protein